MTDFPRILRDANRRLSAELRAAGRSVWSADVGARELEVLDLEVASFVAPEDIAAALGTGAVLRRDRVFAVDGRRVCWSVSWLPADLAAAAGVELDDTGPGGTPARLAEVGREMVSFVEDVQFVEREDVLDQERVKLGIDDITAVARIVRRSSDAAGQVVEVTDQRMVANAYQLRWAWSNQ